MKILISPWSCKIPGGKTNAKNYPYWDHVIDLVRKYTDHAKENLEVFQIAANADEPHIKADRRINGASHDQLYALAKDCDAWASVDNFFHHFAASRKLKAGTVVWTRSDPKIYGYAWNRNLIKGRKYLCHQFAMWKDIEVDEDSFVPPCLVANAILGIPNISIIIPTWNHLNDCLIPCMESVVNHTSPLLLNGTVEVIVVANGCTDGTHDYLDHLQAGSDWLRFQKHDQPLGYPKATNAGIMTARGEFIILLNNDAKILGKDWIEMLLEPFTDENVFVTGPLRGHSGPAGRKFVIFFCAAVRAKAFRKLGCLDETFTPGGGEDTEFCIRCEDAGYKVVQVPHENAMQYSREISLHVGPFPIYHKGEATVKDIPNWDEIFKRNSDMLEARYRKTHAEPKANGRIKLNLGSGGRPMEGYINIDREDPRADLKADVTNLFEHFKPESVDEISAYQLFEHLNPHFAAQTLRHWHGLLKPGGKLIIEVPNTELLCDMFVKADKAERYNILNTMYCPINTTGKGGEHDITAPHLWGWYPEILWDHVVGAGFREALVMPAKGPTGPHYSFRLEATK